MKNYLLEHFKDKYQISDKYCSFDYKEDINIDALSDDWLENRTSYIYKVGVLTVIDNNKCDWVHVIVGTQRENNSMPEVKIEMYFDEGENDDVGRVIYRAVSTLECMHPVFDKD